VAKTDEHIIIITSTRWRKEWERACNCLKILLLL